MPTPPAAPRFSFVGGKGGVGKTTCAAAIGLRLARAGHRTLIISTDPAPSLGDALGQHLGERPRTVRGVPRLSAVEVDAPASLARWVEARRETLQEIALRGTWLDADDVARLLRLTVPGIDEIAGLLEIAELGASPRYDRIVVDTAPTGHLLRMLVMPEVLARVAAVFAHMQAKHHIVVEALQGRRSRDAADLLVESMERDAAGLRGMLRDPLRATVAWVTLPEPMATAETVDAVRWLAAHSIAVDRIVVNRVTPAPPEPCSWCRARTRFEAAAIRGLQRVPDLRKLPLHVVPAQAREPRGAAALARIARQMDRPLRTTGKPAPARPLRATAVLDDRLAPVPASSIVPDEARLVMFGGKGGVGKTTCAAAAALAASRAAPRKRVLLLSTDPAHSLGDALGQALGDEARRVRGGPPNLFARELDAARAFGEIRARLAGAVDRLFESGADAGPRGGVAIVDHDRRVMRDLLELSPPGVDELVAIMEVTDQLAGETGGSYDLVVMDTAPTGHALRLVEMPALAHEWLKTLMSIVLKYQAVAGIGELGSTLLRLSQGVGRLRALLGDPASTRFVAVTRTALLPRAETIRLFERLETAGVSTPILIVNAAGAGTCRRCRAERKVQHEEIRALEAALKRAGRRPTILVAPAEIPPPHGARLASWWGRLAPSTSNSRPPTSNSQRRGARGS